MQPLITRVILMLFDIRDVPLQPFIILRIKETKITVSLGILRERHIHLSRSAVSIDWTARADPWHHKIVKVIVVEEH